MFRRSFVSGLIVVVVVGVASGCGERVEGTSTRPEASPSESIGGTRPSESAGASKDTEAEATRPVAPVELVESNWNALQLLIGEKKGKVVVVDVWSTACEPCMKEFPHLIELQKEYPDDVFAISFDIDYAGIKNKPVTYYRERVLKFLGSQPESKVLHRMCDTPADDLFTEIKLDSIPAVYVYGRDGVLAKRFDGSNSQGEGVSYEKQIRPFVDDLVKSP